MNLSGSLARLQLAGSKHYLQLSERFSGNPLIRDSLSAMAQDLSHHAESLHTLRPKFWKLLRSEEKTLCRAVEEVALDWRAKDNHEAGSLHHCFTHIIALEEPITLKLYSPLIYRLRTEWTDTALDFYVIVRAHLTRLARLMRSFSGDPALVQRCNDLIERFEREAHGPEPQVVKPARKPLKAVRSSRASRKTAGAARKPAASRRRLPLKKASRVATGRPKPQPKRAKPLLKGIKIARRRARR